MMYFGIMASVSLLFCSDSMGVREESVALIFYQA